MEAAATVTGPEGISEGGEMLSDVLRV
jgi:hypothetical protein